MVTVRRNPAADPGDDDRALAIALDGLREGLTQRGIAAAIWGVARVAGEWRPDSPLRSRVRRLIGRARRLPGGGPPGPAAFR